MSMTTNYVTAIYCNTLPTHCNALQHTATHCITLQHNAVHCKSRWCFLKKTRASKCTHTPHHTATRCKLDHSATRCTTLHHTAPHCNTLQQRMVCRGKDLSIKMHTHTAIQCNALHHTVTHCTTLQHTAPRCNTLQHTATRCNSGWCALQRT